MPAIWLVTHPDCTALIRVGAGLRVPIRPRQAPVHCLGQRQGGEAEQQRCHDQRPAAGP